MTNLLNFRCDVSVKRGGIVDAGANERKVRIVAGDSLTHPQPRCGLDEVVPIRSQVGGAQALDVPDVKQLVCIQEMVPTFPVFTLREIDELRVLVLDATPIV